MLPRTTNYITIISNLQNITAPQTINNCRDRMIQALRWLKFERQRSSNYFKNLSDSSSIHSTHFLTHCLELYCTVRSELGRYCLHYIPLHAVHLTIGLLTATCMLMTSSYSICLIVPCRILLSKLLQFLGAVHSWMANIKLLLNPSQTEFFLLGTSQQLCKSEWLITGPVGWLTF